MVFLAAILCLVSVGAAVTTGDTPDLLLLDSTKRARVLQLPSFSPLPGCSVPTYPLTVVDTVSGLLDGHLTLCGGLLRLEEWGMDIHTCIENLQTKCRFQHDQHGPGGYSGDSVLQTTEIGNIFGVWVEGPPLPLPSYLHCQVTVGSTVFILGGANEYENYATAYKLGENEWVGLPNMTRSRASHACAVLDNSIYVIGGEGAETSVERLDLSSLTWNTEPSLPSGAGFYGGQAVVYNSTIYLIHWDGKVYKLYGDPHMELVTSLPQIGYRSTFPTPLVSATDIGC